MNNPGATSCFSSVNVKAMKRLAVKRHFTQASKKRWKAIEESGPKIEWMTGEILGCPDLKIAITPLGSTLKGYAAKESDVEYNISILGGLEEHCAISSTMLLNLEYKESIYAAASSVLKAAGLKTESFGMDILTQIYNYFPFVKIKRLPSAITQYINAVTVPFYASHLFLPTAYGDSELLVRARKNLCLSFLIETHKPSGGSGLTWRRIQSEYFNANWKISWDSVTDKPHLQDWLKWQAVNPFSRKSFQAFQKRWYSQTRLPSLSKTLSALTPTRQAKGRR